MPPQEFILSNNRGERKGGNTVRSSHLCLKHAHTYDGQTSTRMRHHHFSCVCVLACFMLRTIYKNPTFASSLFSLNASMRVGIGQSKADWRLRVGGRRLIVQGVGSWARGFCEIRAPQAGSSGRGKNNRSPSLLRLSPPAIKTPAGFESENSARGVECSAIFISLNAL